MLSNSTVESPDAVADLTFRSMLRCYGLIRRVMHPYFQAHGISPSQWAILRALYRAEQDGSEGSQPSRLCLADLGQRLLIRPPSVTGVVVRLEQNGLLVRTTSSKDQRAKEVGLTARGRTLVRQILQGHAQQVSTMLDGLKAQEQEQLQGLMDHLSTHLESMANDLESHGDHGRNRS